MKHLDLFSGIGGFALATQTVWGDEYENVGFCDNNEFCQQVIKKHWPNAKIYGDIHELKGTIGSADLITSGFPCQPFSDAGKKKGKSDNRYLWPEMLRVIREIRPTWVVGENVAGLIGMAEFETVCSDLEAEGYEVQPFIIPACAVGAPHRRDRVWVVAYSDSNSQPAISFNEDERQGKLVTNVPNTNSTNVQRGFSIKESNGVTLGTIPVPELWETREGLLPQTVLCRTDDGIPNRVDRTQALGNAIVPQVAIEIFRVIRKTASILL